MRDYVCSPAMSLMPRSNRVELTLFGIAWLKTNGAGESILGPTIAVVVRYALRRVPARLFLGVSTHCLRFDKMSPHHTLVEHMTALPFFRRLNGLTLRAIEANP